jgi:hypothetical protein
MPRFAFTPLHAKDFTAGYYPVSSKEEFLDAPLFSPPGVKDRLHQVALQGTVQKDGSFELAGPAGTGAPPGEYVTSRLPRRSSTRPFVTTGPAGSF